MQTKFLEVSIEDHKYRVGKMTPQKGSWIALLLSAKIAPMLDKKENLTLSEAFTAAAVSLKEEEFNSIQSSCLAVILQEDGSPVIMTDGPRAGQWADKWLEENTPAVLQLTVHALMYNLAPFFKSDALNQPLQASR